MIRRGCPALLAASLLGCALGSGQSGPCAQDSLSCGEGPAFELDEDCELEGELNATLGQGDREFVLLLPGADPNRVVGMIGPTYVTFALRVDNPDPDHLMFELELDLEILDGTTWEDDAQRKGVYSGSVVSFDGSSAEILAIVVTPDGWFDGEERRIHVDLRDSCGRRADLVHRILPPAEETSTGTGGDSSTTEYITF